MITVKPGDSNTEITEQDSVMSTDSLFDQTETKNKKLKEDDFVDVESLWRKKSLLETVHKAQNSHSQNQSTNFPKSKQYSSLVKQFNRCMVLKPAFPG